ncbi:hypothetical protein BC829DRAFT_400395 [Chytridium lagenaria]|nr:hypothetical protein BC829DRAFT_400395 [Chytridium lagenaria]
MVRRRNSAAFLVEDTASAAFEEDALRSRMITGRECGNAKGVIVQLAKSAFKSIVRFSVWNPLVVLWLITLVTFELILPRIYISSCKWPIAETLLEDVHAIVLADPQLTDSFSYNQNPGLLLQLTQFYSDIYMRRNFAIITRTLKPRYVLFLGDLMDGGREWGMIFNKELQRFRKIFPPSDAKYYLVIHAYDRYERTFGPANYEFTIANHTFFAGMDDSFEPYIKAESFLSDITKQGLPTSTRILLTHGPYCGPLRNKPPIRQGAGRQYQNLVIEPLTDEILTKLKPSLVLSGDDHDDCVYRHESADYNAEEHSIKTFSWLQGNHFPGFAVLSLSPNPPFGLDKSLHIAKCALPPQIRFYIWYIVLAFITLVLSFFVARIRNSNGKGSAYTQIPLYVLRKDNNSEEDVAFEDKEETHAPFWKGIKEGAMVFLETCGIIIVPYVVVLMVDWM